MSKRAYYKRLDELASWDLDVGCRSIINQSTPLHVEAEEKAETPGTGESQERISVMFKRF